MWENPPGMVGNFLENSGINVPETAQNVFTDSGKGSKTNNSKRIGTSDGGIDNNSYNAYLKLLGDAQAAIESGMNARDYAESRGISSTLTDEEAMLADNYDLRMQADGKRDVFKSRLE